MTESRRGCRVHERPNVCQPSDLLGRRTSLSRPRGGSISTPARRWNRQLSKPLLRSNGPGTCGWTPLVRPVSPSRFVDTGRRSIRLAESRRHVSSPIVALIASTGLPPDQRHQDVHSNARRMFTPTRDRRFPFFAPRNDATGIVTRRTVNRCAPESVMPTLRSDRSCSHCS